MISTERISELLRRYWHVVGGGDPAPSHFSYIMVTKGSEPVGKLVFLVFGSRDSLPRLAIKLARSEQQNLNLQMEYENLRTIASFAANGRVVTPTPLVCLAEDGFVWLAESVVDGIELGINDLSRGHLMFATVVDWLVHLGLSTLGLRSNGPRAHDLPELVRWGEQHVTTDGERAVLARAAESLYRLDSQQVPRVFEQRDMGPWNLLCSRDGTIAVVDWESARATGFPAWDLFYFLAHCGFMVDRSNDMPARIKSYEETFWGRSTFSKNARSALGRYIRSLALDEEWLGALAVGCWLHHTLSEVARLGIRPSQSLFWHMLIATLDRKCRLSAMT